MGEKPILSTKGHVFRIDPVTKRDWLPQSGNQSVPLVIYHDVDKMTYRIIAFDAQKTVLVNSSVTSQMKLTRSSSKFCQWTDSRAKVTFGLGFGSSSELQQFAEKFEEAVTNLKSSSGSPAAVTPTTEKPLSSTLPKGTSTSATSSSSDKVPEEKTRQQERAAPPQTAPKPSPKPTRSNTQEEEEQKVDGPTTRPAAHEQGESSALGPGSPVRKGTRDQPSSGNKRTNLLSRLKTGSSPKDADDEDSDGRSQRLSNQDLRSSHRLSNQDLQSEGNEHDLWSPVNEPARTNSLKTESDTSPKRQRKASISGPSGRDVSEQYTQLKKENDQLKIALATSSANAKSWEAELQKLKHNNVRLTTALQESTGNVDEWKKQLTLYKEENAQLKQKVNDTELSQHQIAAFQQESERLDKANASLSRELAAVKNKLQQKEEECAQLTTALNGLADVERQRQQLKQDLEFVTGDKEQLLDKVSSLQDQLHLARTASAIRLERLTEEHKSLGKALHEAMTFHGHMQQELQ